MATEGEEHARIFEVHCIIAQPMTVTESGRGSSRRLAEQDAAEMVLGRRRASYDRSVDVHISNLRRKLVSIGGELEIETVRGIGYRMKIAS